MSASFLYFFVLCVFPVDFFLYVPLCRFYFTQVPTPFFFPCSPFLDSFRFCSSFSSSPCALFCSHSTLFISCSLPVFFLLFLLLSISTHSFPQHFPSFLSSPFFFFFLTPIPAPIYLPLLSNRYRPPPFFPKPPTTNEENGGAEFLA